MGPTRVKRVKMDIDYLYKVYDRASAPAPAPNLIVVPLNSLHHVGGQRFCVQSVNDDRSDFKATNVSTTFRPRILQPALFRHHLVELEQKLLQSL